jgi:hypothetical protein
MLRRFRYILILTLALLGALNASSQIAMPDSVCIGATKHYWVNGSPGSNYSWAIDGSALPGNSFEIWHTWSVAGNFSLTVQETSADGCIGPLLSGNVIVSPDVTSTSSVTACDSYTWNGTTYTTSGTYTAFFAGGSVQGCDSTAILNLTINNAVTSTSSVTSCNSYTWNGTTYTTSGT